MHFMKILTVYTLNSHLLTLKAHTTKKSYAELFEAKCGSRGGGGGGRGPEPPGKSKVIWVSILNKQLDPPPPTGKSWTPLENVGYPLEP